MGWVESKWAARYSPLPGANAFFDITISSVTERNIAYKISFCRNSAGNEFRSLFEQRQIKYSEVETVEMDL